MRYSGKIISLAFPDTFVQHSEESSTKILLAFGLGRHNYIKAGHAAFVLIENASGHAAYYDFGRYITPPGYGRVRSATTDVELEIPFKAIFTEDMALSNIEKFLLWLEAHPEKTHGSGRLVASVCDYIDYKKAKDYITSIQKKGSIPYKAFGKEGSNCSRIVTDTILASTDHNKIRIPLLRNKLFTPSPLGNVEKSALFNPIYQVYNKKLSVYSGSVLKENLTNYFDKNIPSTIVENIDQPKEFLQNAQFLSGTGSSAYFTLDATQEKQIVKITRYTQYGVQDFKGFFRVENASFDASKAFRFVYDSNCQYCHVAQKGQKIRMDLVKRLA
ncbi:hypothetical protein J8281_17885 [Aquimarina sp. U1-2]|uniref:DUF6695 family protein n=1 Tax=Aquimarina sp. U1-2 TaxID=2823141 RepID=UPI001AEC9822|nr:DUF6695 family protein [Aquimarina sp. U1-2]MBP2834072.1 hypothetical protein [Aquimarina sp. U1-2]